MRFLRPAYFDERISSFFLLLHAFYSTNFPNSTNPIIFSLFLFVSPSSVIFSF